MSAHQTALSKIRVARLRLEQDVKSDAVQRAFLVMLKQAEVDLWAHGLTDDKHFTCGGCDECDDDLIAPYVRAAIRVAEEVLGTD